MNFVGNVFDYVRYIVGYVKKVSKNDSYQNVIKIVTLMAIGI